MFVGSRFAARLCSPGTDSAPSTAGNFGSGTQGEKSFDFGTELQDVFNNDSEDGDTEAKVETEVETETQEPEVDNTNDGEGNDEENANTTPDVTEVDVDGRKLSVDWAKRDEIIEHIKAAMRYRTASREHLRTQRELETVKQDLEVASKGRDFHSAIVKANEIGGWKEVVKEIYGDTFDEMLQVEIDRRNRWTMVPEEQRQFEMEREALEVEKRRHKLELTEREKQEKLRLEGTAKAEQERASGMVTPAFHACKFTGKLGDEELENSLNAALWTSATKQLTALHEAGRKVDARVAQRVFQETAKRYQERFDKQADETARKHVEKAKANAQTQLRNSQSSRGATTSSGKGTDEALSKGDFRSAFTNFMNE